MDILLILSIVMTFAILLGGYYMKYQAPKDEQMKMGFRTEPAKASPEAWAYANRTCGTYWLIIGIIGFVMTEAVFLIYGFIGDNWANVFAIITTAVICVGTSSACTAVIKELRSKFDENGRPKEKE